MKKIILILIVYCARVALIAPLLIPSTRDCFAQSITWQRTYQNPVIMGDDEAFDVCQADGSNFYVVGSSASFDPYFYILKLNQYGDTIWTRTFGQGGRALAVAPSEDGGCVFTGLRGAPFSIKLNLNGDIIWDKVYNGGLEAHDIIKTGDSGYAICGSLFSGYICKIDTLGNLQWDTIYSGNIEFETIELAIDGGYIIGGQKFDSSYLLKINGSGNIIWEKIYPEISIIRSICKKNSGYIIASTARIDNSFKIVLYKVDLNGNLLQKDTIPSQIDNLKPSIISLNQNKFQISIIRDFINSEIMTLDSNLNIIKQLIIPDTNSYFLSLYSILKAPMSNFDDVLLTGIHQFGFNDEDIYIVRLDSSLAPPPPIAVTNISNEIPPANVLFQNYPNPFNVTSTIRFAISENADVSINIYDVLGRQIMSFGQEKLQRGVYMIKINMLSFSSGLYFYQLIVNGVLMDTKKLILIK